MLDAKLLNVNGDSLPGPLIIGTFEKWANLVPRALFPGFGRPAPKAREKRPRDEVGKGPQLGTEHTTVKWPILKHNNHFMSQARRTRHFARGRDLKKRLHAVDCCGSSSLLRPHRELKQRRGRRQRERQKKAIGLY